MKIASESDIGLCRSENQDMAVCEILDDSAFVVVCDGMGGENSGKDASSIAAEVVKNKFLAGFDRSFARRVLRICLFLRYLLQIQWFLTRQMLNRRSQEWVLPVLQHI